MSLVVRRLLFNNMLISNKLVSYSIVSSVILLQIRSYKLYSSKNPYHFSFTPEELTIRGNDSHLLHNYQTLTDFDNQNLDLDNSYVGCKPIHLHVLARHGSRYPGKADTENAKKVLKKIQGKVINSELLSLNEWELPYPAAQMMELAPTGVKEHLDIGYRFAKKYEQLLKSCSSEEYEFQASSRSRTIDSGVAFKNGMEEYLKTELSTEMVIVDKFMRFFDSCPLYKHSVKEQKRNSNNDLELYKLCDRIRKSSQNVLDKLQIPVNTMEFTAGELKAIYSLASLSEVLQLKSPWTDILNETDMETLEYMQDLKHYWTRSYAQSINYEQACNLFGDIFGYLERAIQGHRTNNTYKKAVFRFGHAETLIPVMSILGLYSEDIPLKADNFHLHKNRNFRTSKFMPFASSMAFVLYHCPKKTQEYQVQLLVREMPESFPHCGSSVSAFENLKSHYKKYLNCNFQEICHMDREDNETQHYEL